MNTEVLKTILEEKDCYYYIIENYSCCYDYFRKVNNESKELVFIAFDNEIKKIIYENTIDTIKFCDVEKIEDSYIIQNIFLSPSYTPFQMHLKLFRFHL